MFPLTPNSGQSKNPKFHSFSNPAKQIALWERIAVFKRFHLNGHTIFFPQTQKLDESDNFSGGSYSIMKSSYCKSISRIIKETNEMKLHISGSRQYREN